MRSAALAAVAACGLFGVSIAQGGALDLTTVRVASGLVRPVFVTHAPGDFNRLYIVEKRGVIKVMDMTTMVVTTFMDIDARVGGGTSNNDERGLLGLAFHPGFGTTNDDFIVYYTNNDCGANQSCNTVVSRFTLLGGDPDVGDPNSEDPILTADQPFSNHNGGWIGFGPNDGYLYIALGDGGSANDPQNNGQNRTTIFGNILRIDVDGNNGPGGTYGIPVDNPFVGNGSGWREEIWAFGLRNPYRCSFDRVTGDLYIGDVGQDAREEIDFQFATSMGGENYGWRCREGEIANPNVACAPVTTATNPVHTYAHGGVPFVCSIIAGYAYRGCAMPGMEETFFFADFCSDQIWSCTINAGGTGINGLTLRNTELAPGGGLSITEIVSFGEDAFGEMYIVDQGSLGTDGEIYKIIPTSGPFTDCNTNMVEDACEILSGAVADDNMNGIPDSCEPPAACDGDVDGNLAVDVNDITYIVFRLGSMPGSCGEGDADGGGTVDVNDISYVVFRLGTCNPGGCP